MTTFAILLPSTLNTTLKAALTAAANPYLSGAPDMDGDELVLPVAVPEGVWVGVVLPIVGAVDIGAREGTLAVRMSHAMSVLARDKLPVRSTSSEDGKTVLLLNIPPGGRLPILGMLAIRWNNDVVH